MLVVAESGAHLADCTCRRRPLCGPLERTLISISNYSSIRSIRFAPRCWAGIRPLRAGVWDSIASFACLTHFMSSLARLAALVGQPRRPRPPQRPGPATRSLEPESHSADTTINTSLVRSLAPLDDCGWSRRAKEQWRERKVGLGFNRRVRALCAMAAAHFQSTLRAPQVRTSAQTRGAPQQTSLFSLGAAPWQRFGSRRGPEDERALLRAGPRNVRRHLVGDITPLAPGPAATVTSGNNLSRQPLLPLCRANFRSAGNARRRRHL